jgi:4-hydroxybenzoate polyprenyltransferase
LLAGNLKVDKVDFFIFFATLFLYSLHRLIGIYKLNHAGQPLRFAYLQQLQIFFTLWTGGAGLTSLIFFLLLPSNVQLLALLPIVLSAGYALPFLPGKRRLRDLAYLKVLLVALSWAWVTIILPAAQYNFWYNLPVCIMFLSRFCFIFAIAITFDIRDLHIDQLQQVRTIPTKFGIKNTKFLAISFLILMLIFTWINYQLDTYNLQQFLALSLSAILTATLILFVKTHYNDYYYSGLLDGMILLQAVLIFII